MSTERIVSIHQPNFLPRLKVLQKIANSDIYIVFDDVQFVRNDWQNRVIIRNYSTNHTSWISLPVHKPHGQKSSISEISFVDQKNTLDKAFRQIQSAYFKSPFWHEMESLFNRLFYSTTGLDNLLSDYLYNSLCAIFRELEIKTTVVRSSSFAQPVHTEKNAHLLWLCNAVDGDAYICGTGGLSYIDKNLFLENGIEVIVQSWNDSEMIKRFGCDTWKNVSFIDFWARFGRESLVSLLTEGIDSTGC